VATPSVQPFPASVPKMNLMGRSTLMLRKSASRRLRLFLFPFAGAGASAFRAWPAGLSPDIEIYALQPPGRESRIAEPPFSSLQALVRALADDVSGLALEPYAFFGHSMGALVAFELSRELRTRGHNEPVHLIVSGFRAPYLPPRRAALHRLADDSLVDELRRLDGTLPEVLDQPDLLELVLPTLRADLAVCETYDYRSERPLSCRVSAWGGTLDSDLNETELYGWSATTSGPFAVQRFHGGHMYIVGAGPVLAQRLSQTLAEAPESA
jgi:medium-chain acyl-[acyl-carrier-protein] hydrolase